MAKTKTKTRPTSGYVRLAAHRYVVVKQGKVVARVKSHAAARRVLGRR
jgi:hypothetical protein